MMKKISVLSLLFLCASQLEAKSDIQPVVIVVKSPEEARDVLTNLSQSGKIEDKSVRVLAPSQDLSSPYAPHHSSYSAYDDSDQNKDTKDWKKSCSKSCKKREKCQKKKYMSDLASQKGDLSEDNWQALRTRDAQEHPRHRSRSWDKNIMSLEDFRREFDRTMGQMNDMFSLNNLSDFEPETSMMSDFASDRAFKRDVMDRAAIARENLARQESKGSMDRAALGPDAMNEEIVPKDPIAELIDAVAAQDSGPQNQGSDASQAMQTAYSSSSQSWSKRGNEKPDFHIEKSSGYDQAFRNPQTHGQWVHSGAHKDMTKNPQMEQKRQALFLPNDDVIQLVSILPTP
jgi:hypothetical protein